MFGDKKSGPSCSKLMTSFVHVSLNFQKLILKYANFFVEKNEKLLQKLLSFFQQKNSLYLVIKSKNI